MHNHQQVLISAVKTSRLSAKEIAALSSVNESTLSRFLSGKQDLKAGDYFSVLNTMPETTKKLALLKLGVGEFDFRSLILAASSEEKAEILTVIADWISQPQEQLSKTSEFNSFASVV
jgi:transcriptional regulator with XRE-family HTH domain